jgi:hypothetical protein
MNSKRLYIVLCTAIGLLLIGMIAGAYGINTLLHGEANKLTALKAKDAALEQQEIGFVKAKKEILTYGDLEKVTRAIVPEDKNQAEAVRELVNIAGANDITLASISFPASTLGAAVSTSTGGSTAPAQAGGAPAGGNGAIDKKNALSQLEPVKNIPGVYLLQIVVQGDQKNPVRYDKFISFLDALEHNRRTAQVSSITLQPSTANPNLLNFTLTINEYIKP